MKPASQEVSFTSKEVPPIKTLVKPLRTGAGLTQQQLARMVHVSARTIISIETGQYSPSLMLAYRLARVFDTTVEELCCLQENLRLENQHLEQERQ